ncbi:MAG TPA: hypothetical protein VMF91_27535 [Bryobacteraceae bacterium]|nr:hypothetical protein [Bryobacteraceae bacterium]
MQTFFARALVLLCLPMTLPASSAQVSVIDSGSTNRPGATITVDEAGNATVEQRNAEPQTTKLDAQLCEQLMRDVKAAGTLSALPEQHCPKSVSFGSSLYVEFNGDRSPDISCSPQADPRSAALQKDAKEILETVRKKLGLSRFRPVRPVRPIQ